MYEQRCYSFGDLENDLFIAFTDAIEAYDPTGETKFTSFLNYPIQNRCLTALGLRHSTEFHVPVSLDLPINEETGGILSDLIEDENARIPFEYVERNIYSEQVSSVLMAEVHSLPNNQGEYLTEYFVHGLSNSQIAEKYGETVGRISGQKRKGLQTLRRSRSLSAIRQDAIDGIAYHSSFSSWENHGRSSSTERAALQL